MSDRPQLHVSPARREPIAIIGMGCRFPGANSPEALWDLLISGRDAISEVPPDRFPVDEFYAPQGGPGKISTRWGGFIPEADHFDAAFFRISPREAARMDPQHRLLLEVAWEAIEDAGLVPASLAGSNTGVFVGMLVNDYEHLEYEDPTNIDVYVTA